MVMAEATVVEAMVEEATVAATAVDSEVARGGKMVEEATMAVKTAGTMEVVGKVEVETVEGKAVESTHSRRHSRKM